MKLRDLRRYRNPDLSDYVVHFTGRSGENNPLVPPDIVAREAWDRLAQIMMTFGIKAFPPFGLGDPVVCFTECTISGIKALMSESRYQACGVAFTKDYVFKQGGGPAFYVRGDEWPAIEHLPAALRARTTRFWPGAIPEHGEMLPWYLQRPSEWLHEREWRILGKGAPPRLPFQWEDVAFLITPHPNWQSFVGSYIGSFSDDTYEQAFMKIPSVVVAQDGTAIQDPDHIWII
jgi:hypothetical protein